MNKQTYSTYRCATNDFGKYALIGAIKYKIENDLDIYPIYVTFKASISSSRYYDESIFNLRIWLEGSTVNYSLVEVSSSNLFECCLDILPDTINIYVTTNSVAGGTITVEELTSVNSGFVEWRNFEKFNFNESDFTKKVIGSSFDKIFKSAVEYTKEIKASHSLILNKDLSPAPIRCQRVQSNGGTIEGNAFITSNGKFFIGLRGSENEALGNENHSGFRFADSQIQFIGDIIPSITNKLNIGNKDYKIKNIYSDSLILSPVSSLPTEGLVNGYTVFYTVLKMQCTYYNGKWYSSNGQEVV